MDLLKCFFILFISGVATAQTFECQSLKAHDRQNQRQPIKLVGSLNTNQELERVTLSLLSEKDGRDHEVISVDGPIAYDPKFHPHSPKLMGYQKFVLEKKNDAFWFFLPNALLGSSFTGYVKISFEGTYPNLEELSCIFN